MQAESTASEIVLEDASTRVISGSRGGLAVLLRSSSKERPTAHDLRRLRYGAAVSQSLDLPGVMLVHAVETHGDRVVVAMEDFGGRPLRRLLEGRRLEVREALAIAVQLAATLGDLHRRQVVHRGVEPANVYVDRATGTVKIANFDSASRLTRDSPVVTAASRIEGALAYISPEQTGRMNRAVDYRTDLYSLGVTLYEMLTGKLPFHGGDAAALVHSHLTALPEPPQQVNPAVDGAVSSIVMKLLAKNAEDRYQSAHGLGADLRECEGQLKSQGTITDFTPGVHDLAAGFQIPQKLYGRARERGELLTTLARVSDGAAEAWVLAGGSGVGKTALVREVHRSTIERRGYFLSGAFDPHHSVPHAALIQAFQALIRELLSEGEPRIAVVRAALIEALGSIGQVVIDLVPEVALILGPQPRVPALDPAPTESRLHLAVQRFVGVLADRAHPLVIFLDDLQWADAASLDLVRRLIADPGARSLLLVGAYRDEEVGAGHPLVGALEALRRGPTPLHEVTLGPLDPADVLQMVLDTLGCPEGDDARDLARFVARKTQGNPLFVTQLLTSLHARRRLTFDADLGRFQWSLAEIQEARIPGDVAGLLAERIQRLPEASRRALGLASLLGLSFDLADLAALSERAAEEVAAALWEPIEAGLLLPIGDEYKYLEARGASAAAEAGSVRYEFPSERVREAAAAQIEGEARPALHLGIGRRMLASATAEDLDARLFAIVNQLDAGAARLDDAGERREVARLNLLASRKAQGAAAYAIAIAYLDVGVARMGADAWEIDHDLALRLHAQRALCAILIGRLDAAERDVEEALARAATAEEKAEIYSLKRLLCLRRGDDAGGARAERSALALHGVDVPEAEGIEAAVAVQSALLRERLAGRDLAVLADLKEAFDAQARARARLIAQAILHGAEGEPGRLQLLALHQINASLEHGVAPGSALGYVMYARSLGAADDHLAAHALGRVAMALAERLDEADVRARVGFVFGAYVSPWLRPARSSSPILERSAAVLFEAGSPHESGLASAHRETLALLGGDELGALHDRALRDFEVQRRLGDGPVAGLFAGVLEATSLLVRGEIAAEQEALALRARAPSAQVTRSLLGLMVAVIFDDRPRALACAKGGSARLHDVVGHVAEAELRFYRALLFAAIEAEGEGEGEERAARRETLREDLSRLERYRMQCPSNFAAKHLLAAAEVARVSGDEVRAMGLYDQAIEAAAAHEAPHHQALANELAGRFHLARGRRKIARAYLVDARAGYLRWGAAAKVAALDAAHQGLLPRDGGREAESPRGAAIDLLAVLAASRAISRETGREELLGAIMSAVIEGAGAQRGLLVIAAAREVVVEASAGAPILITEAPIEARRDVPLAIVRYVERTRESVVLGDAANAGQFRADPYVAQRRPRSILCAPLVEGQRLVGVLYLENNLALGAFTPARCGALELLAAQAAISLERARRYDALESRERARTQELSASHDDLSRTLTRLKETQKQLIVQEKMASLGALTSGIAHEIKNPLNFINNFAELSVGLVDDLRAEVQAEAGGISADSAAVIEEILADLQQNAAKINEHGKRADDIVRAMLEHSRSGVGERRDVDVNALLAEYANLAYQGFRSQDSAFNVSIETSYDPEVGLLPLVPQEIGRVFLNLINNACYAARAQRQRLGERFSPTLRLTTRRVGDQVEIRVRDNGDGVPAAVLEKIFNPFFTTKPTGEGTGLGLSISHEIVQSNGGTLAVDTAPGSHAEFIITLPRRRAPS